MKDERKQLQEELNELKQEQKNLISLEVSELEVLIIALKSYVSKLQHNSFTSNNIEQINKLGKKLSNRGN